MLKTIYVVRHAGTDWNHHKKLQGWTNTHLNQEGIEQAKDIAEWFKNKTIDRIYSSDLARSQESARFLCEDKKIKALTTNLLRGRNFGEVAGMTFEEIKKKNPEVYKNLINETDALWNKLGIEALINLRSRIQTFFNKINPNDEHIVLITHGAAIRHILRFFGLITDSDRPKIPHASVTIIDISNKNKFSYKIIKTDKSS